MKKYFQFIFAITASIILSACAKGGSSRPNNPLNLPPVGGQENPNNVNPSTTSSDDKQILKPILDTGKRAVEWLNLVNEKRDPTTRLNLADKTTKNPVPPEKPSVSSTALLIKKYNEKKSALPPEMASYLFENKELTSTPPVSDEDFIKAIRGFNGVYQGAIRWLGHQPYLNYYERNSMYDIRGYYFFKKNPEMITGLKDFSSFSDEQKANAKNWIISMCKNSGFEYSECSAEIETSVTENKVFEKYDKYLGQSEKTYNEFFEVNPIREDLKWNSDQSIITQDFILPELQKVATWLKTNVEEEWKATGFQLIINFVQQNNISPFVEFVKGVTPHVSGETWNKITMDPDYSLDDYDTQWTIRHEFGHVLGFPDCYLEFYNKESQEMVYYTIEPDNLMCAWGGHLQSSHVSELKKSYK